MTYPAFVNIVELEQAPFRNSADADVWARSHGVIGLMSSVDTGGKGEISISAQSIDVLYGCATYGDIPYRVKTTLKRYYQNIDPTKAYSYEITNVEVLRGTVAPIARPSDKNSTFDVAILLQGVCDVNGVPLLKGVTWRE